MRGSATKQSLVRCVYRSIDAGLKRDNKQNRGVVSGMNVLLIEPILDRYVAQAERREKNWSPKEVEALLLKLRKEILDCLK
jgi:hypothetical protein